MRQSQSCLEVDVEPEVELDLELDFELEFEPEVERDVEVLIDVDVLVELEVDGGFDFCAVGLAACPGKAITPIKTTRATFAERILLFE